MTGRLSQSISYFTVPSRAHPSAGSSSGSAAPALPVSNTNTEYSLPACRDVYGCSLSLFALYC